MCQWLVMKCISCNNRNMDFLAINFHSAVLSMIESIRPYHQAMPRCAKTHLHFTHSNSCTLCTLSRSQTSRYITVCCLLFNMFQFKLFSILHTLTPIELQNQIMFDIFQFGFGRHSKTSPLVYGSFQFRGRNETMRQIICRGDAD